MHSGLHYSWGEIHFSIGIWGRVWTLNLQEQKCNNEVKAVNI